MPPANPLEQLRRRMQSHAAPAAFAAAAEEHRRAGRFAEAIAVCRDGLDRYPSYASARVTLGRALLDSGDVAGALAELELAVAQAPDNLAASRALEAARGAQGASPAPSPPAHPVSTMSLHGTVVATEPHEAPSSGSVAAMGDGAPELGPDRPQELGLGPDWLPIDPELRPDSALLPLPLEISAPPPLSAAPLAAAGEGPLQGEEPAGIWPAPLLDADRAPASGGAPVYSWAFDPSTAGAPAPTPGIWDEPTIEAPLPVTLVSSEAPAETAAAGPPEHLSADPGGTGQWTGRFIDRVTDGAAPAVFSGWDGRRPSERELPTWSGAPAAEPGTAAFTVPGLWEGSSPVGQGDAGEWQAGECPLPPASHTPEWLAPSIAIDPSVAAPEAMGEWTIATPPVGSTPAEPRSAAPGSGAPVLTERAHKEEAPIEPIPAPAYQPTPVLAPSMWDGSLASAVGEVFARAGHAGPPDRPQLDAPMYPEVAVRDAMADAAVEATLEDVAQQGDASSPALITLQQMLDAVRARRAALHADMQH